MKKITIAIDGYSSCGKSTIAKALAAKLGYSYVDSGAMYRSITLFCIRRGIIKDGRFDHSDVIRELDNINLTFVYNPAAKASDTYLNGENVEREIRTLDVSSHVSHISLIREVRQKLVAIQREMGKNKGVVMDGRDIGTNVFPDAELKIFVTADTDVRTQRRVDELRAKGHKVSVEEVKKNLLHRDYEDSHRKENPLVQAPDAIVLDNTDLTREEQLDFVFSRVMELKLEQD
ncbi:MAG: cytidylate kinase [Bacteroidetes bacterium]|nr:MAG: cytidylate kinase [Bacteroidota bacterium]